MTNFSSGDSQAVFLAIFGSTATTLDAERILEQKGISFRIISAPAKIKGDCGLALQFEEADAKTGFVTLQLSGLNAQIYRRIGREDPIFEGLLENLVRQEEPDSN